MREGHLIVYPLANVINNGTGGGSICFSADGGGLDSECTEQWKQAVVSHVRDGASSKVIPTPENVVGIVGVIG